MKTTKEIRDLIRAADDLRDMVEALGRHSDVGDIVVENYENALEAVLKKCPPRCLCNYPERNEKFPKHCRKCGDRIDNQVQ